MYQNELFKDTQQTVMEPEVSNAQDDAGEIMIGIVANCTKLNVREEPRANASIICEVACQTELMIDEAESTEEFFKVCTAAGIEGFCMKKFIAVQP